jgi:hypothetical protein
VARSLPRRRRRPAPHLVSTETAGRDYPLRERAGRPYERCASAITRMDWQIKRVSLTLFPKPDFSEMGMHFVKARKNIFEWYLTFYDADGIKVMDRSVNASMGSPELGPFSRP